jgi:ABC-type multidrug transport system fused ATPase/permease subunit
VLLYLQVSVGFLAGVVIILVMVPLNRIIATKIGTATTELMIHKDARVRLIAECFRSIKSIKMSGLEDTMATRSMAHRDKELTFLSERKYLDAWCVFLWASLPLLVPYLTFVTTVAALNRQLTASEVFTTLALLNMLIFPMNAYPWIINGAVESAVSIRRLASVLVVPTYSPDLDERETRLDLGARPVPSPTTLSPIFPTDEHSDSLQQTDSTLSSLFSGRADDLGTEDLVSLKTSRVPAAALSLIEANDLLVSWNEATLRPSYPPRSASRDSDRLLVQQLTLEDSNFTVGPVTLSGVRPGQVPFISPSLSLLCLPLALSGRSSGSVEGLAPGKLLS